jgi:membrane fusion protein, multidrug efflux system
MAQTMTIERTADGLPQDISVRPGRVSVRKGLLKRTALGTLAVLGLAAGIHFGVDYWRVGRFLVSTDDAYVQADNTLIAPRISGYISQVLVADNQTVKAGQVLARIDDRDFQTALRQAAADRDSAVAEIRSIDAQLALQASMIDEATQQVTSAEAALRFAQQDHARYDELSRTGAGTTQSAQQTQSQLIQRSAGLLQARAALAAAKQQVDVLQANRVKARNNRLGLTLAIPRSLRRSPAPWARAPCASGSMSRPVPSLWRWSRWTASTSSPTTRRRN